MLFKFGGSPQTLIRERLHKENAVSFTVKYDFEIFSHLNFFSFKVVRHPFERIVSAYRHLSFLDRFGLGKLNFYEFLQENVIKVSLINYLKCLYLSYRHHGGLTNLLL